MMIMMPVMPSRMGVGGSLEYIDYYEEEALRDDSWRRHDPSSTGLVFRYIQFQDWCNGGQAFYRMLVKGLRFPFWLILIGRGGAIYAVFKAVFLSGSPST
jgi:hypothetical protein